MFPAMQGVFCKQTQLTLGQTTHKLNHAIMHSYSNGVHEVRNGLHSHTDLPGNNDSGETCTN